MESALLHAASAAETQSLSFLDIALWVVLPYMSFAILIVGLAWRYKTDQYGWTSRSSQWNEPTILRWASPLFHFGVLFVFMGHILGLVIPKTWTEAAGVPEHVYHLMATIPGTIAGIMTIVGLAMLIYRRLVYKSVRPQRRMHRPRTEAGASRGRTPRRRARRCGQERPRGHHGSRSGEVRGQMPTPATPGSARAATWRVCGSESMR